MAARPESLPPTAFRRNVQPPRLTSGLRDGQKFTGKLSSRLKRRAVIMALAPVLVEKGRDFQIRTASGGYRYYQSKGRFKDEVAQIVDGSVSKPVSAVRFGGNITWVENPGGLVAVAQAAAFVIDYAIQTSRLYSKRTPPIIHAESYVALINGQAVSATELMSKWAKRTDWEEARIVNIAPYAAKLEAEYAKFDHMLYGAWKQARLAGWHARVSMRFQIGAQNYPAVDGGRIRRPELVIQRLGAFASRDHARRKL
ncbi:hypothetical protein [Falsiruegeria mediterranea]